jgi:hypothetical protein
MKDHLMNCMYRTVVGYVALNAVLWLPGRSTAQASSYEGGTIRRGALEADFSSRGVMREVRYQGAPLFGQHGGGVSTSGHGSERWSPWVAQSSEYRGDVTVTLEEDGSSAVVTVRGTLSPRDIDGISTYELRTTLTDGRIQQSARITTSVEGLWHTFGSAYLLDPDRLAWSCYRGDDQPWRVITDTRGDRNLIPPSRASSELELVSADYRLRFQFEGVKTAFFDDRDRGVRDFKLEFGMPQQAVTDERGDTRYEAYFEVTIEVRQNETGETPLEIPRRDVVPEDTALLILDKRPLDAPATRRHYSLDGEWRIQPVGGGSDFPKDVFSYPPPAGVWTPVTVPHPRYPTDGWDGPAHAAWFHVQFMPPESLSRDHTVVLHFEEISYWSVFYLNGQKVGEHFGGYVPVRIDITRHLRPGAPNTLEIFVGDNTAALDPAKFPDGAPPNTRWNNMTVPDSLIAPVYWSHRGILQSVQLEAVPHLHVDDVFVKTSVREGRLEVETTVANQTEEIQIVQIRQQVLDDGAVMKELPAVDLTVPPKGTAVAVQSIDWADARLWDVGQPYLYHVETVLEHAGTTLDALRTRFGFREFWIEGPDFILNGKPIRLREAATHAYYHPGRVDWDARFAGDLKAGARAEIEAVQAANFNATRMVHRPHPRFFYDICDELGHLAISHMPFGFHRSQFQLDHPCLIPHSARMVSGLVRKERNHPSIVMWEVQNEGFPYGLEPDAYRMAEFYNQGVIEPIRRMDPTRPAKGGGDGDLMGRADVIDMHGGDWPGLDDIPLPNSNWQVLERSSTRCYGYAGGLRWRWDRSKPLYFGEGLYWMLENNKNRAARFIGEAVFDDPHLGDQWVRGQEQYLEVGQAVYWRIGLPVWRMLGELSGYCPWAVAPGFGTTLTMTNRPVINAAREMLMPERFFTKQLYRHFYARAPVHLDVCFINDARDRHLYRIQWQAEFDGAQIAGEAVDLALDPADTGWRTVAFTAPDTQEEGVLTLTVSMSRDGVIVYEEAFALRIYPHGREHAPEGLRIRLVDPVGDTASALDVLRIPYERVDTVADAITGRPDAVLIGQNAMNRDIALTLDLDEYVRDGGRVLILSQEQMKSYGPMARPDDDQRRTRSLVFPTAVQHPLLSGITAEELHFWNHPDWDQAHTVALHSRQKFTQGAVHAVLECDSLWFSPLQEVHFGNGLYIEASLDLVRKVEHEPVAAKFWSNLLDRLADWRAPDAAMLHVLRDAERVEQLRKLGIVSGVAESIVPAGILLVTDHSRMTVEEAGAIQQLLANGGTLWVHARADADVSTLQAITGLAIQTAPYTRDWRAREVRRTEAGRMQGPLTGISSVALYERNSVEDLWTVSGAEQIELATGGAVVEASVGAGRIVIDRIAWEAPTTLAHRQWAEHYVSALASALGVEIDPYRYAPRRQFNPADFATIDLRLVVNRAFRSEVAGDGRGWTDQGPGNDLRGMQAGRRVFHQVPFDIIDPDANQGRSCLVLHAQEHAPAGARMTEEIEVGAQVDALFFLHTAAWFTPRQHSDRPLIRYIITYDDNQVTTVEALGGQHIRDWWSPGDAELARGISLLLQSDTEPDAPARRRGLQMQEWINPHPERTIRSLRIESAESGAIPIVLAVTAWRKNP